MGTIVISNPAEAPGTSATGDVTAISKYLAGKTSAVVFFVHGVGDHCPGFALDNTAGWLNDKAVGVIGLVAKPGSSVTSTDILDSEFLPGHPQDRASKVTVRVREFTYPASAPAAQQIPVRAIEITWSQLTQWVKTNQLGYDLTGPAEPPTTRTADCPYPQNGEYKKPLDREVLNHLLKEETLDRSLVDAVLYAGTYGRVMRRGMAEALCRALKGTRNPGGRLCTWPAVPDEPVRSQTAYFFVTHSLGSRLVYDTLLGLIGTDVTTSAGTFANAEITASSESVKNFIVQTASIYMMANQLPLLGLAYEDGTHTSADGPVPYELFMSRSPISATPGGAPMQNAPLASVARKANLKSSVGALADLRMQYANKQRQPVDTLKVVAFSDPNDLLSWGIPKWYLRPVDESRPAVEFTNVYLQNSPHWLGLIENPAPAHANYFVNDEVWRVIVCGATKGKLNPCN
ncbi:MAG: hypothetical protein ACREPT_03745 [Rudaea sp.]